VAAAISIIRKIVPAGIGDPFRQLRTRDSIITHSSFTHDSMKAEKHHPASLLLRFARYRFLRGISGGTSTNVHREKFFSRLLLECLQRRHVARAMSPFLPPSLSLSLCLSVSRSQARASVHSRILGVAKRRSIMTIGRAGQVFREAAIRGHRLTRRILGICVSSIIPSRYASSHEPKVPPRNRMHYSPPIACRGVT